MKAYSVARFALLVSAFALATAAIGWWAVPGVALVWGILDRDETVTVVGVGLAAGLSWGVLLAWVARSGHVGLLTLKLADLLRLPSAALYAVTLAFPVILAGSATGVAKGLGRWSLHSSRLGS